MRYLVILLFLFSGIANAQQDSTRPLRIADTLTLKEQQERNPVLLRSEVDSLVKLYMPPAVILPDRVSQSPNYDLLILVGICILIILAVYAIARLNRIGGRANGTIPEPGQGSLAMKDKPKEKPTIALLEKKIITISDTLDKLTKEKSVLQNTIAGYNGIQQELDSLKAGIKKAYKIRHYPGGSKTGGVTSMNSVFQTENAVAGYAYNQLLKPLLEITDNNKNHPAKTSEEDRGEIMNLLISLSLLYIEYLYLRVNELAVGGKMVERISGIIKGNAPDPALLKPLDTEFGSRALVLKITLDKAGVHELIYPVFDETNLLNK